MWSWWSCYSKVYKPLTLILGTFVFSICIFRCIAALLGAQVILTDLPDRMKLLKKNVETNVKEGNERGTATVSELEWGDDPDCELIDPLPDISKP